MAEIHFINGKKLKLDEKDIRNIDELIKFTKSKTNIQALRTAIDLTLALYRKVKEGKKICYYDEKGRLTEIILPK